MRPRSRTLKAVHAAILDDIVTPAAITGRSTRVTMQEGRRHRVFIDPLDKDAVDAKLEAFSHAYARLTTHKVHFEYSKPTTFQKTKLDKKSSRK
jgi:small subunit ribosomal protein S7e